MWTVKPPSRSVPVVVGRRVLVACAFVSLVFALWPYVTLFRLAEAMRQGDVTTLQALVDWDQLREGIEEDICDAAFEAPDTKPAASGTELPPFGYSFARGIASSVIEAEVNAVALVAALHTSGPTGSAIAPGVVWAFFDGPTSFSVVLQRPGAAKHEPPIRVRLELRHEAWTVTRVWLPPRMLMQANAAN